MTDGQRLVLGPTAGVLRRRLGPTAWVVLEELLAHSTPTSRGRHAEVSVRSLAADVGLAKDTVARALSRLRAEGIVAACQARGESGVFGVGGYVIAVPTALAVDNDDDTTSIPTSTLNASATRTRQTSTSIPSATRTRSTATSSCVDSQLVLGWD